MIDLAMPPSTLRVKFFLIASSSTECCLPSATISKLNKEEKRTDRGYSFCTFFFFFTRGTPPPYRPVHRRDRIVSHVVADSDAAVEQFDGQMFGMTVVQQNPVFLRRREHDRYVRLGLRSQRFQFDERRVVHETQAGQIFATFACGQ